VEQSPEKGNTDSFSSYGSLHTGSENFTLFNMQTSQKLFHISKGSDFWTYADWEFFDHLSEYYTPLSHKTSLGKW
jgi:hypothetical protein